MNVNPGTVRERGDVPCLLNLKAEMKTGEGFLKVPPDMVKGRDFQKETPEGGVQDEMWRVLLMLVRESLIPAAHSRIPDPEPLNLDDLSPVALSQPGRTRK